MANCKTCRAEILWIKMASGSNMPVDAKPQNFVVIEAGQGRVQSGYVSHFATCPDADKHRKGK